jgi:hypothetical protein
MHCRFKFPRNLVPGQALNWCHEPIVNPSFAPILCGQKQISAPIECNFDYLCIQTDQKSVGILIAREIACLSPHTLVTTPWN